MFPVAHESSLSEGGNSHSGQDNYCYNTFKIIHVLVSSSNCLRHQPHQATATHTQTTRADSRRVCGPKLYSQTQFLNAIFHSCLPHTQSKGWLPFPRKRAAACLGLVGLQAGAFCPPQPRDEEQEPLPALRGLASGAGRN